MAKHWANTWTEIEDLGNGKFAAEIHIGHRVFKDKIDGQYKKHKLTDERPAKDYVLIQSAKCCVEVYPYYVKYFDVDHEEVRLYEERWVVQRLFKAPDKWKDVGAWNPITTTEETDSGIAVTINYTTDYGSLIVKYIQRDGAALKHDVIFTNTSGGTETFRVLQKWAGIVGDKCNGQDFPLVTEDSYLAFHDADKPKGKFNIAENLHSMVFNPDGSEKTNQCLQMPISIETHAQGMKADLIYGNWILAQNEILTIDPDTVTLSDSTEDGWVRGDISRDNSADNLLIGLYTAKVYRSYVEWDVSSIPNGSTITDTVFKYECAFHNVDGHIHEMVGARPSTSTDQQVWDEAGEGTVYADPAGFPVAGVNKEVDLGASADSDLEDQLSVGWFAIGIQGDSEAASYSYLRSEQYASTPDPTLYVEYTVPPVKLSGTSVNAISAIGALTLGIVEKLLGTSVNAVSTIGGNITFIHKMAGTAVCVVSTVGVLNATLCLAGISAITVATSSALNLKYIIAGTSAAYVSAVVGHLRVIYSYSGTSANVLSAVGGILNVSKKLSSTSVNKVSTTGAIGVTLDLKGTATNTLSTMGSFVIALVLKGVSASTISTVGTLNVSFSLYGTSVSTISTIGALTLGITEKISGTSTCAVLTIGSLGITLDLKGTSVNVVSTLGGFGITLSLTGSSANVLSTTGDVINCTLALTGTSENVTSTLSDILNAILVFEGTSTNVISTIAPELIAANYRKLLGTSINVFNTSGIIGLFHYLSGLSANDISAICDELFLNVSWWGKMGKGSSSFAETGKGSSSWTEEIKIHK